MKSSDLQGKWWVYDMTARFKGRSIEEIRKTMAGVDQGKTNLSALVTPATPGIPDVSVEIKADSRMNMTILNSMRPGMPATMRIGAVLGWALNGDKLTTTPDPVELTVGVEVDPAGLAGDELAGLKEKAAGIQAGALQGMKADPMWNHANVVTVLHCGARTFLTQASPGNLMLHVRKEGTL